MQNHNFKFIKKENNPKNPQIVSKKHLITYLKNE